MSYGVNGGGFWHIISGQLYLVSFVEALDCKEDGGVARERQFDVLDVERSNFDHGGAHSKLSCYL